MWIVQHGVVLINILNSSPAGVTFYKEGALSDHRGDARYGLLGLASRLQGLTGFVSEIGTSW